MAGGVPVIGEGASIIVPRTRGSRRREDAALLAPIATLTGTEVAIPGPGRPRGGIGRTIARGLDVQRAQGVPLAEAARKLRRHACRSGWAVEHGLDHPRLRRQSARDRRRDQQGATKAPDG